jgi:plastocyanin
MIKRFKSLIMLCAGVLFFVVPCAGEQQSVTVGPAKGGEVVVAMKASSYKFEPDSIKAYKGDVIVLQIENISGSGHNFTIKDPQGNVLQSLPLPSKETVTAKISLSEPGTYEFHCSKPFHTGFGMKGQIAVVEEP